MEIKDIAIILLIIGVVAMGSYYHFYPNTIIEKQEPKSILDIKFLGWYENEYNSNEMFFDYYLINYGDVEGKNIKVKCNVDDLNDNNLFSEIFYFGNIASNSYVYKESITKNIETNNNQEYYSYCFVESCDNCEILWEKIPELIEEYMK